MERDPRASYRIGHIQGSPDIECNDYIFREGLMTKLNQAALTAAILETNKSGICHYDLLSNEIYKGSVGVVAEGATVAYKRDRDMFSLVASCMETGFELGMVYQRILQTGGVQ